MDMPTIVVVLLYVLVTCYLGYLGYRQTKTAADYLLAGRSAHPVIMALSYGATFISTSAIVGFGGQAANLGMGLLWLTVLNISVGIFIAFVFLGGPTRRMGHHLDAHTFPELLGRRYNSRGLQIFTGLIIFLFMPLYAMAVMVGMAQFIVNEFQLSLNVALFICAIIVALYVIAGGLKGVMLTDALQGTIMLVGMVVLLVTTYAVLGGLTPAHKQLTDLGDAQKRVPAPLQAMGHQGWTSMPKFGWGQAAPALAPAAPVPAAIVPAPAATLPAPAASAKPRTPDKHDLWWILVTTITLGVGIGVLAQPQLIVRFMTVKSKQSLNRAVMSGGVFILFMTGVAFVVGALSNVYFAKKETFRCTIANPAALLDPGADGKQKLAVVQLDALQGEARATIEKRSKRFVEYRLPGETEADVPHYVLYLPGATKFLDAAGAERNAADVKAGDTIQLMPGLISIQRSVGPGTTMSGDVDRIIPRYVGSALPKWFRIVFLLTLLSAAMSTMSSQFHTMGTALGRDVFEQIARRHSGKSIMIARLATIVGIIMALVVGKLVGDNIVAKATAVFFALCAATFLPAFVGGLIWRRMNKAAAVASMSVGFLVSLFWLVFVNYDSALKIGLCKWVTGGTKLTLVPPTWSPTWGVMDALIVALPLSILAAIIVPFLTKPMDKKYVDYCFGGRKP